MYFQIKCELLSVNLKEANSFDYYRNIIKLNLALCYITRRDNLKKKTKKCKFLALLQNLFWNLELNFWGLNDIN